jgi:hypothetical protein
LNFSFAGHNYTFVPLIIKNTLPEDECSGNQCSPENLSEDNATYNFLFFFHNNISN